LRRKLIESKLTGEIDAADFQIMKESIEAEIQKIEEERRSSDSEASTIRN
jgi:hypothetical protein